jgi:hypothetical protein
MLKFLIALLVTATSINALAVEINNIHCEGDYSGEREIISFDREGTSLSESSEKFNANGYVYWSETLNVLNPESVCGIPVKWSDCEFKDDAIGPSQTLEVVCRDARNVLYANLMISIRKATDSWDMTRTCGITVSRIFNEKRFANCHIN